MPDGFDLSSEICSQWQGEFTLSGNFMAGDPQLTVTYPGLTGATVYSVIVISPAGDRRAFDSETTTDTRGAVWWQLENSGWIARADVVERGDCSGKAVPIAGRVAAPPTNTYSLERCESFSGPVRSGQRVTFEFIPPAWDNIGEALAALRTDPGRFIINSNQYYATVSAPFQLGENVDPLEGRYLRRFALIWTAEPGTYRITGDWLHYEPICDLTVPVE